MPSISEAIRDFIVSEIVHGSSTQELDDDFQLLEGGVLDSLGLQQLLTFLEQQFGIVISDDDLMPENFASVRAIADLVANSQ